MSLFGIFSKKANVVDKQDKSNGSKPVYHSSIFSKIKRAIVSKSHIDEDTLDEIEEILISSDVGVDTSVKIIKNLQDRVKKDKYVNIKEVYDLLKNEIIRIFESKKKLQYDTKTDKKPYIIMVVGINGVGKTTTIAKLANKYKKQNLKVILSASDTFRAAAVEQLSVWAERLGIDIVKQKENADPASVAYNSLEKAKSNGADVVIVDTAGRLHNKINLMDELSKIKRVIGKNIQGAPNEILLILDGSLGQNSLEQSKSFIKYIDVNSIAITKLDGTAKGGILINIADNLDVPIKYIGTGEKIDDIKDFSYEDFVDSLFDKNLD